MRVWVFGVWREWENFLIKERVKESASLFCAQKYKTKTNKWFCALCWWLNIDYWILNGDVFILGSFGHLLPRRHWRIFVLVSVQILKFYIFILDVFGDSTHFSGSRSQSKSNLGLRGPILEFNWFSKNYNFLWISAVPCLLSPLFLISIFCLLT